MMSVVDAAASPAITLRPVTTEDAEFLFRLHVAVSAAAVEAAEAVEEEQVVPTLRRHYTAHEANHRDLHPAATHHVIELDGEPIGQCRLGPHPHPATRGRPDGDALVLVDLAVLPKHDQLGSAVVGALRRHVEWFGVSLWADESACTREPAPTSGPTSGRTAQYGAADDNVRS